MESEKEKWFQIFGLISDPTQRLKGGTKKPLKNDDGAENSQISFLLKFCQGKPHLWNDVLNALYQKLKKTDHDLSEKNTELSLCKENQYEEEESCEQTYTKEPIRTNIKESSDRNYYRDKKIIQKIVNDQIEEYEEKYEKELAEKEKCQVDEHEHDEYEEKHELNCLEKGISELNMLSTSSEGHDVCMYSGLNIITSWQYSICNNEHVCLFETRRHDDCLELKKSNKLDSLSAAFYIRYENNMCKSSLPVKCLSKNIIEMFTPHDMNTSHNYTAAILMYDVLKPVTQSMMFSSQTLDLVNSELKLITGTSQAETKEKLLCEYEASDTDDEKQQLALKSNKKRKMKKKMKYYFKSTERNKKMNFKKMNSGRHHKYVRKVPRKKSMKNRLRNKLDQQKYWIFKKLDKIKMSHEQKRKNRRSSQHFGYHFGTWSNNNRNNNIPFPCGPHKVRTHSGADYSGGGGGGTGSGAANGGGTSGNSQSNGGSSGSQANGGSSNGRNGGKGGSGDDRKNNGNNRSNNSSPSLPNPKLDDKHIAMRENVERQRGSITNTSKNLQTGNPALQTGNPALQTGNPALRTGNPVIITGADGVQAETKEAMMQAQGQDGYDDVISVQHATLSILQLCDLLGTATNNIPISSEAVINLNLCLTHALHDLSFSSQLASNDIMSISECTTCNVLSQILKHLASLTHIQMAQSCDQCSQIFNLILWHSALCIRVGRRKARLSRCDLCYKICKSAKWNAEMLKTNQRKLLFKVKKYCAKVLGSSIETFERDISPSKQGPAVGIGETDNRFSETEALNLFSANSSLSFNGNIVTTESFYTAEQQEQLRQEAPSHSTPYPHTVSPHSSMGSSSSSSMPGFGPSSTNSMPGFGPSSTSSMPGFGPSSTSSIPGFGSLTSMPCHSSASHGDTHTHNKLCRKNSQRRSTSIPQPIAEESTFDESTEDPDVPFSGPKDEFDQFMVGRYSEDPYDTQRTYGEQNRHTSMPIGNVHEPEQFMSLWKYPIGEPGVSTVVFGHPSQLRRVANYWVKKREECEKTGNCPYQHREEGVILAEQKDKFSILRTRYQKNVQWQRLTHLGNGMSGKCHLAMDMKTSFKFCCKKIHLLRYSEEELSLWTEMQHSYIVKLYAAIRHGVKIYIFSEFIDGGDLAACIEEQKRLGRRLSHWSAINYFKQLLQVLEYLQSKNILHEDIKADNILLRQNTKYIAVTDFGTSRKLQDPKELKNKSPVGSATHWSPEKASMEGHGFPSDLWAAVCVLVHMLSGSPPWLKRFHHAGMLNFIIYAQPPPMDDVPQNVQEVVRKLIEKGLVKDPQYRPSPSELLQDPAFSILNEETPETYYSTLVSHHPVRPGVRPTDVSDDHQENKSMVKTTVLTVSPNKTVLYKQHISTSAPDNTQVQHDISENLDTKQEEQLTNDTSENSETKQDKIIDESQEDSDKTKLLKSPLQAQPVNKLELKNSCENSGMNEQISKAQHPQRPQLAPRVSELVEPRSIEKLLPDFAELFPDDDSENMKSIKHFFVDSYCDGDLSLREKPPLQVYTPEANLNDQFSPGEKEANHLPILSIFDASIEASAPANDENLNVTLITSSVMTQINTASYVLTNSNLTLSSESECASSELFDTVPSVPLDESEKFCQAQNVEDVNDLSGAFPLTTTYTTNLMQRKPINLKLDLNCPPMSRSASPSENNSLTSGGADTRRSSAGIQTASPPRFVSRQPSPSSGQSTGALQRQSTHSGSTSSLPQSFIQNSVMEEQNRILLEFNVSGSDATLPGITDADFVDTEDNAHRNDGDTQQDDVTGDYASMLSRLQNEIDDATLDGLKLEFYNHSKEKLFEIRIAESPIYLKYIIGIARNKIRQCQYIHFTLCYLNGALLDFFRPISSMQLKVVQLTDPADKCLCGRCPAIF